MNRATVILSAFIFLVGFGLADVSLAQGRHHGPPGGHSGPLEQITEELDLDAETREAVQGIIDETHKEAEALHSEVREAKEKLHKLLAQDEPDEAAVMAHVESLGELETQAHKFRIGTILRIRSLLTPEQRNELTQMRKEGKRECTRRVHEACSTEIENLCPEAECPREAMRCLSQNQDELSDACESALSEGPRSGFCGSKP